MSSSASRARPRRVIPSEQAGVLSIPSLVGMGEEVGGENVGGQAAEAAGGQAGGGEGEGGRDGVEGGDRGAPGAAGSGARTGAE